MLMEFFRIPLARDGNNEFQNFFYCEEPILSRQVEMAGRRMYYLVDAQAIHRHIPSTKGDPVKSIQHWKRLRLYFVNHYSGDSWIGKKLVSFSIKLYVQLFIWTRSRY